MNRPAQRTELEPGFVLHARSYRESSLLLEVFSRQFGRTGLVARGAKSSKSRWKNILQPFRPLLLSWTVRGELGTLVGAEQVAALPPGNGEAWFCGLYVNELLMRALHRNDPHPDLFDSYRKLLQDLAGKAPTQPVLRIFEKQLLEAIGFGMQLGVEPATGEMVHGDGWYRYHPDSGPVRMDGAGSGAQKWVSGAALLALESETIEEQYLPELKRLMRQVLRYHLGDKPLVSQSLFQ